MALKLSQKITRRGFVVAGAAATASAAALQLTGCKSNDGTPEKIVEEMYLQFPGAQIEYLDVDPTQVISHTTLNAVDALDFLEEYHSFDIPLGSLVYQSSDTQALVVGPGTSSKALIRLGFVDFSSGEITNLLGQALGASEDYVIYDARASDAAIIWVECNMVHGLWRVYATPLEDSTATEEIMQQAQLLDEGEATYSPPRLAVAGSKVYWTVMPDPNGEASAEDSYLMAADYGKNKPGVQVEPSAIYISHGRMLTTPVVSGDVLTIVPRVDTEVVCYQLTTLDLKTDEVKNIAMLPQSRRVSDAVWQETGFTFSAEGNDEFAGGLSLFGTYQQLGGGRYLYTNKAPVCPTVKIGDFTFVKSTKNILGLNPENGYVLIVDTPQDCVVYGDILAGAGKQNRLVLYTTVTSKVGKQKGLCNVRIYDMY